MRSRSKPAVTAKMKYALYPSLENKHVLITGGGTGIGATLVESFAMQGACVSFLDIADEASLALKESLRACAYQPQFTHCDLTNLDDVKQAFAQIESRRGPINILINNAANDTRHDVTQTTAQQWDASIAVNLRHQFFCAKAVLPSMVATGGGVILNLGSISWHLALPDLVMYMTSKAAIEGLTRGLARDFGAYNIRVNTIVPGAIRTPRQTMLWHTPEEEAKILAGQCLKQRVEPEDVAALALFLASDNSARCTGREYFVDAGWYGA